MSVVSQAANARYAAVSTSAEVAIGNSGASKLIDWTAGFAQKMTLNNACTVTFTAPAVPSMLMLRLTQDGTGTRVVTWPTIKWVGGVAPVLTITPTVGVDIVRLWYDGAAYWEIGRGLALA
jgi:hypothetical protein